MLGIHLIFLFTAEMLFSFWNLSEKGEFQGGGEVSYINPDRLCIAKSIPVVYFDEPW